MMTSIQSPGQYAAGFRNEIYQVMNMLCCIDSTTTEARPDNTTRNFTGKEAWQTYFQALSSTVMATRGGKPNNCNIVHFQAVRCLGLQRAYELYFLLVWDLKNEDFTLCGVRSPENRFYGSKGGLGLELNLLH